MSTASFVPPEFAALVDLASDATGAFAVWASDDYFAPKENLLKAGAPEWHEGEYTDRGKWMDGWESQRRREPGHDSAIVRLGTPGRIHGFLVDTTWFRGNAPEAVGVDLIEAPDTATARDLEQHPGWRTLLPRTDVKPHHPNVIALPEPSARATHVRLHQFPDGGIARLRVYGEVAPEPRLFWREGSVDLAAVESGGTIAAVSDQFFGPPSNLLLPGRGVNMGDGWETKRRRTPGSDWCVIRLARRGVVTHLELDTHYFKGNAPQATLVELLDAEDGAPLPAEVLRGREIWRVLVEKTPLVPHRRHVLEPARRVSATHLRVHIFPHGGVNRLRIYGVALDTPGEAHAREVLNALLATHRDGSGDGDPDGDEARDGVSARTLLRAWNGASRFAHELLAMAPFPSVRAIFAAADEAWWRCTEADRREAFAAHPRIGQQTAAATHAGNPNEQSARWSRGEQAGMQSASDETAARMAELNARYFERFGFIFICVATGRSASEMLALLEQRIENDAATELDNAAREQARITRLRIGKWLLGQGA